MNAVGGFGLLEGFSFETQLAVWNKAIHAPGMTPNTYRLDPCGALIRWDKYGDTTPNGTGWEIDHIYPASLGGSDNLSNLQALQWENNRKKGDNYPTNPSEYTAVAWKRT